MMIVNQIDKFQYTQNVLIDNENKIKLIYIELVICMTKNKQESNTNNNDNNNNNSFYYNYNYIVLTTINIEQSTFSVDSIIQQAEPENKLHYS